jgi:sialate O-acetylesterase
MKKIILILSTTALCALTAGAKVKLPGVIGQGMVLQRQSEASLWGWTDAGKSVSVRTSWNSKTYSAKAGNDGRWMIKVATGQAGGPYSITFSDGERLTVGDVMIGEVWVCSGQSNMEMRMAGNNGQPVDGALNEILAAGKYRDRLRMITVPHNSTGEPQADIPSSAGWQAASPEVLGGWSAVAYYFARNVTDVLGIPVGIVATSWGGSAIETWMDEKTVLGVEGIDRERVRGLKNDNSAIGRLYNGMILPVKDYTARGFLWYQGEANLSAYKEYAAEQAAMVGLWRRSWGDEQMPFYFVQIAPYRYGDSDQMSLGFLTEAQLNSLKLIPNSGMASTTDIGDEYCIHPPQKDVVGRRLALLALSETYGVKGFPAHGPLYKEAKFENGRALVTFEYSRSLSPENQELCGFEIAGANRVFVPATARVVNGRAQVELFSPIVKQPVAVRYAWRNYMKANLTDTYGIAAYPFRTDDW